MSVKITAYRAEPDVVGRRISRMERSRPVILQGMEPGLADRGPGRIIFLSVYEDASFVEAAQDLGAMGYVLKSSADRDLVPAIHEALQGRFFHSPSLL